MDDVDLMNIGSYTELPGGNIALPGGYSTLLAPIIKGIPEEKILKQKPVKVIHWRHKEDADGYESDSSDCSVRTVKSVGKSLIISRPGGSQGLLYKHLRHSLIN